MSTNNVKGVSTRSKYKSKIVPAAVNKSAMRRNALKNSADTNPVPKRIMKQKTLHKKSSDAKGKRPLPTGKDEKKDKKDKKAETKKKNDEKGKLTEKKKNKKDDMDEEENERDAIVNAALKATKYGSVESIKAQESAQEDEYLKTITKLAVSVSCGMTSLEPLWFINAKTIQQVGARDKYMQYLNPKNQDEGNMFDKEYKAASRNQPYMSYESWATDQLARHGVKKQYVKTYKEEVFKLFDKHPLLYQSGIFKMLSEGYRHGTRDRGLSSLDDHENKMHENDPEFKKGFFGMEVWKKDFSHLNPDNILHWAIVISETCSRPHYVFHRAVSILVEKEMFWGIDKYRKTMALLMFCCHGLELIPETLFLVTSLQKAYDITPHEMKITDFEQKLINLFK